MTATGMPGSGMPGPAMTDAGMTNSGLTAWLFSPRRLVTVIGLLAAWCALWGSFSVANVLSGVPVAVGALLIAGNRSDSGRRIRVWPLTQLLWLVLVDLVISTYTVVREILTPTDHTEECIIAVDTSTSARAHLLLLVVAITVTPGTAVIDTDQDTGRLYIHLLHADAAGEVTAHVQRLAELACAALPIDALPIREVDV